MHALSPLIHEESMQKVLDGFRPRYLHHYTKLMRKKLGLYSDDRKDRLLIRSCLKVLQESAVDYTAFFRQLSCYQGDPSIFKKLQIKSSSLHSWLKVYENRLQKETTSPEQRETKMSATNPKYVLKNYMLQEAVEGLEKGDRSVFDILKVLLRSPYDEHKKHEHYAQSTAKNKRNLQLSCSS